MSNDISHPLYKLIKAIIRETAESASDRSPHTMTVPQHQPASTTAAITYLVGPPKGVRAYQNINFDPKTGEQDKNWTRIDKEAVIENLRGKEDSATLDTAGFQLFTRPSKHTAFTNDADVEREYYPESIELIKEMTGASRVVLFDHSKDFWHVLVTGVTVT